MTAAKTVEKWFKHYLILHYPVFCFWFFRAAPKKVSGPPGVLVPQNFKFLSPISQSFSTTHIIFMNVCNQLQRVVSFIGFIQIELCSVSTWIISSWNHNCAVFTSYNLCFYFYTALLDLPVQPTASEVLGFGQTANASPSALPFRFYEQSRRAPNDPTANRSVFASVDKVPGDINLNKLSRLPYYLEYSKWIHLALSVVLFEVYLFFLP